MGVMPKGVLIENLQKILCEEIWYTTDVDYNVEHDNALRVFKDSQNRLALLLPWEITPLAIYPNTFSGGIWVSGKRAFGFKNIIYFTYKNDMYFLEEDLNGKWGTAMIDKASSERKNPVLGIHEIAPFSYSSAREALDYTKIDCNECSFTDVRNPEGSLLVHEIKGYTPALIQSLQYNEVFVFGSNLEGQHHGGAARVAHEKFGAVWGLGVGLAGNSYAIPTMHGGVDSIRPYVDQFVNLAEQLKDKTFLVTPIGCGIAGFTAEEIAPLFKKAVNLQNVRLPREFVEIILAQK